MVTAEIPFLDLAKVADSGQAFRIKVIDDYHVELVAFGRYLQIAQTGKDTFAFSCDAKDFENIWKTYLDLGRDYGKIVKSIDRNDDYPVYGRKTAEAVMRGEVDKGVVICGTGVGISLAANKVPGIRCCVCSEPYSARMSVEHNNANMLSMGARVIGRELAKTIVDAFFGATFEGGRHARRVEMITDIEETYSKNPVD